MNLMDVLQSAQGASNPAIGGDKVREDGPAQEIAGTLPADFSLKGMKVCVARANRRNKLMTRS